MKERIFSAPEQPDVRAAFVSDLQYKIAVSGLKYVREFPSVFEIGESQYGVAVDSLLEHILVGNMGLSETTTTSRNADFLKIFDACCGYHLYRDQHDPSSVVLLKPDDTVTHNGAVVFKNEAKGDPRHKTMAEGELTDKMDEGAIKLFPANSQSIFAMTSFPTSIHIYAMDFELTINAFTITHLRGFDMRHLGERVQFVQAIFKIAQWISKVHGPQAPFHLIPGVRFQTPNGHHITWLKGMILKELKQAIWTRGAVTDMSEQLQRINQVYVARLANVEWGAVQEPNLLKVTRIGFTLETALHGHMITKEIAIAHITQGEEDSV